MSKNDEFHYECGGWYLLPNGLFCHYSCGNPEIEKKTFEKLGKVEIRKNRIGFSEIFGKDKENKNG